LIHNPKEFYLTGVDFFLSKKAVFEHDNYQEYYEGYLPNKIRIQGNKINKGKLEDGHSMIENTKFIKELYDNHSNFRMPGFIERLLIGICEGRFKQQ
jgi:hypothetical protein